VANTRGRRPTSRAAVRKQPQQPRAEVTYEAMLEATARVLDQSGVEGLTTNRVAEVAGVSIGSLYQYFPNKQALIAALLDRYMAAIASAVGTTIAAYHDAPVEEILRGIARAISTVYHDQHPVHRHLSALGDAVGLADRRKDAIAGMLVMVEAYLRAHPELDVRAPQTAAFVVVHAVDGVLNGFADHRLLEIDAEIEELVVMLTRYLKTA
jgi:AcrR family transcriptional regulator